VCVGYISALFAIPPTIPQVARTAYFTDSTGWIPSAHMMIYAHASVELHPNLSGADVDMDYAFCSSDSCVLQMSLKPNQPTKGVNQ